MPLFGKKKADISKHGDARSKKDFGNGMSGSAHNKSRNSSSSSTTPTIEQSGDGPNYRTPHYDPDEMAQTQPKLIFHCQQAHGSPTACISGFTSVKELYSSIASSFDIEPTDVCINII